MKLPEGRLRKITGFMVENKDGEIVFALNEIDFAYHDEDGYRPRILYHDEARKVFNKLYKQFPK